MHYHQGPNKRTEVQQANFASFVTERRNCTHVQIPDFLKISVEWLCTISSCFGSDQNTTKTNQNGTKQFVRTHSKLNLSELMLKSEVLSTSFIFPPSHPYIYRPQWGWSSTVIFTCHAILPARCQFWLPVYLCPNLSFTLSLKYRKPCSN